MLPLLQAKSPFATWKGFQWATVGLNRCFRSPLCALLQSTLQPLTVTSHTWRFWVSPGFLLEKKGGLLYQTQWCRDCLSKKNIIRIPTNKKKGREGKSRTWSGVQWSSSVTLCRIQNSFQGWWMWVDVNFELCYLCYIHVIISRFSQSSNSWYCDRTKSCTWNFLHVLGCRKSITFVDFVGIIPFNHSWNLGESLRPVFWCCYWPNRLGNRSWA